MSAKPLHLTSKERSEIAHLFYHQLIQDWDAEVALIEVAVYGNLVTLLVDERLVDVSDVIFIETLHWNEKLEAARTQVREALRGYLIVPWISNQLGLELQLTRPLAGELVRLARRLSQ
ncbi:hypothetical protein WDW37_20575 [Bdellovibrionota bacterium FG-1]